MESFDVIAALLVNVIASICRNLFGLSLLRTIEIYSFTRVYVFPDPAEDW